MPQSPRPVIGLTGAIGAGKSTVARVLESAGCVVVNSDEDARAALLDPAIRRELVSWWGEEVLDPQGRIDRTAVADIVFGDPAERRRLEALTHPWIEARRRAAFAAAPPECPALVIDAPLLMEVGLDAACDVVLFVDAPEDARRARVGRTRGWGPEELARRSASQMPLDLKRNRADHVITNDGDPDELRERVLAVLRDILHE